MVNLQIEEYLKFTNDCVELSLDRKKAKEPNVPACERVYLCEGSLWRTILSVPQSSWGLAANADLCIIYIVYSHLLKVFPDFFQGLMNLL